MLIKRNILVLSITMLLYGCSTTEPVTQPQPDSKIDTVDFTTMLEPPRSWHHFDEQETRFRGISSRLAYDTILKDKEPEREVIVAVIDGGVDIQHEDLREILWVNEDEIPDNNIDDDKNGYTDDIHGWNFIGGSDGKNVDNDTFELTRIYRRLKNKFGKADTTALNQSEKEEYRYYRKILNDYEQKVMDLANQYNNVSSLENSMKQADQILTEQFGDDNYTYEDLRSFSPKDQQQQFAQQVMMYVMENDIDSTVIADQKKQIYEFAKYGYNPEFTTRQIVGDNYQDKSERFYGNGDVEGPDPSHGTHVAGIVAAMRDNGLGMDGVATGTRIMAIRAVPNGDERDKDVANAIKYAVENGADVINMSFGKGYSPYKEVVDEAIRFAEKNGVLMVHGAGNDAKNTDVESSFPTPYYGQTKDGASATLWLTVGASSWKPNEKFVAGFSNYGKRSVDLFAPGVDIYSTMPDDEYQFNDGTSMASPVVAGVAALIMAYYPELTTQQVKEVIYSNTVKYTGQRVIKPNQEGAEEPLVPFDTLSSSGGIVNLYKSLQAAEALSSASKANKKVP